MKKFSTSMFVFLMGILLTMSCILFVGCDRPVDTPPIDDTPDVPDDTDDDTNDDGTDDNTFSEYLGDYVMEDDEAGISYQLTLEANEDFILVITRQFDGFIGTKTYIGPTKNIDGDNMSPMPIFLSDFSFSGENAPSQEDTDIVMEYIESFMAEFRLQAEPTRQTHIIVNKDTRTFTLAEDYNNPLDITEDWWFVSDLPEDE